MTYDGQSSGNSHDTAKKGVQRLITSTCSVGMLCRGIRRRREFGRLGNAFCDAEWLFDNAAPKSENGVVSVRGTSLCHCHLQTWPTSRRICGKCVVQSSLTQWSRGAVAPFGVRVPEGRGAIISSSVFFYLPVPCTEAGTPRFSSRTRRKTGTPIPLHDCTMHPSQLHPSRPRS